MDDKYTAALWAISPTSVLLAAFVIMLVGGIWYSPLLFGKSWTRHTGIRPGDARPAEIRRNYVLAALSALFISYLLAVIAAHATSPHALIFSILLIWLFIMLEQLNSFIWERAAFALFLMHAFRSFASLSAAAAVHYYL